VSFPDSLRLLYQHQDPSTIPAEQVDQLMVCLVDGMAADKPVEIQQVSAQGMVHALAFAEGNFADANASQRNMIMSCICNATQFPDVKVNSWRLLCAVLVGLPLSQPVLPLCTLGSTSSCRHHHDTCMFQERIRVPAVIRC
jgi:hypothetical protein